MRSNQSPRQYSGWRRWREIIQIWGLVIPGFAGILIAIASLIFSPKDLVLSVLLFLFSILALAIGLERYDAIGEERIGAQRKHQELLQAINQSQSIIQKDNLNLEKEIAEVHLALVNTAVAIRRLRGHEDVYQEAIRLIKACKGSEFIRATSLAHYPNVSITYQDYFETLAKTIGQVKQKRLGMVYKVIIGFQPHEKGGIPVEGQEAIVRRRKVFEQYNALDRLEIRYFDHSWTLNLLIIGNEHLIIGFPTIPGDPRLRAGIRISDKDFVESVARWYEEYLWSQAKAIDWTDKETQQ